MLHIRRASRQRGSTLVEVLVAIALTAVMLPTMATALITSHAGRATSQQQLQATSLLHEATEAVRTMQIADWNAIAADGTYHVVISGNSWALAAGPETAGGFTREIIISAARRDAAGALVQSGGAADPAAKHVEVTISWTTPYDGSVGGDMYLTRWQHNAAWEQTVQPAFAAGTLTDTVTTSTDGGEVQLAPGSPAYQDSGTFESDTFDAGAAVAYNRLSFTASQPADTLVKLQVAINTDNTAWDYIGPDGTANTYFTAADTSLPLSAAGGRYLRYKAYLSGPGTTTPVVNDVTVNYSL